jgi:RNA polymerase sigma-70 factor (ECF subfamily)
MKSAGGKRALYGVWVRDYSADVYRCAFRLCGHADCAEELTQEVFFEAWRSIDSLRDAAKARVWLLSILRHRYMHWLRDRKRHPAQAGSAHGEVGALVSQEDQPGEIMARQESLRAALDALEDHYKVPFLLVFLEGLTCQEAADFLDIPLGTVLSRIYRARQFLRQHLETEGSEGGHLRIFKEEHERDEPSAGMGGAR